MDEPVALDDNHPGWSELTPEEQQQFLNLSKMDEEELSPVEEAELALLKDMIKYGRPKMSIGLG